MISKNLHIALSFLFFLVIVPVFAQTYVIPDPNFKQCIINHDPNLLDVNGNLIIANAANASGRFYCAGDQVTNIDGIQFFTNIAELELRENLLTNVDPIASLTQLAILNLNDNKLTSIPSLATFSNLIFLNIHVNNLSTIPELPTNSSLLSLDASNNFLTEYPDLSQQDRLEFINLSRNSGIKKIETYNNLTSVKEFVVYICGLEQFPDVSMMTNLEILNIGYNHLTTIPNLSANTKLKTLYANDNALVSFADLSATPTLETVRLYDNFLSFEDFEKLQPIPNYSEVYKLLPQREFPNPLAENYVEADSMSFVTGIANTADNVNYKWFYNDELFWEGNRDTLNIPFAEEENSGTYRFEISSTDFPELTLTSYPITVNITPCMNVNGIYTTIEGASCKKSGSLEVKAENQPQNNLTYRLESTVSDKVLYSENGIFEHLNTPEYILFAEAGRCKKEIETIQLPVEACEEAYFTPNGDGMDDTYYFQDLGTAVIYNKWGQKIQELKIPTEWDGQINSNGIITPGYYTVEINNGEKIFHLSVVY